MPAPINNNGSTTRAIGRRLSDSSPNSSESKGCPARMPASMRIVEPELPQSSGPRGGEIRRLVPAIFIDPSLRSMMAPKSSIQRRVVAQSAPVEKLARVVFPLASVASMAYRCEIDLSPGSRTAPTRLFAGRIDLESPLCICALKSCLMAEK
jgi:hypothetical protein